MRSYYWCNFDDIVKSITLTLARTFHWLPCVAHSQWWYVSLSNSQRPWVPRSRACLVRALHTSKADFTYRSCSGNVSVDFAAKTWVPDGRIMMVLSSRLRQGSHRNDKRIHNLLNIDLASRCRLLAKSCSKLTRYISSVDFTMYLYYQYYPYFLFINGDKVWSDSQYCSDFAAKFECWALF